MARDRSNPANVAALWRYDSPEVQGMTSAAIDPRQRTVAALIGDGVLTFDFACACEVFGYDRSDIVTPWYRFLVASQDPPPIRTSTGFLMAADLGLEALDEADTIVVPGWADDLRPPRPETIDALRAAYARGARLMSICIGSFVLAATGLLDGRRATTHWRFAERLQRAFPAVEVDPSVLYIDDGQILTSAGTAAGIDLGLHVVRLDYGAEVANEVARRIVMPPHRDGGQAQYIAAPMPVLAADDPIRDTLAWIVEHLDEEMAVDGLAARAAMSPRSFLRHFKATTGTTPLDWILGQRVRLAQRLLETTDLPLELVAERAGFGAAVTMRHHFAQRVRTSPQAYRRTFRDRAPQPA
ncbi:MAG TPA: helix-turn-helix domain-containing protein [Candidatus Limnocylindrales bacterium]|nr:helix-turn-helix domain-containing protein [Candidatus Limnocylindrales bacterium]